MNFFPWRSSADSDNDIEWNEAMFTPEARLHMLPFNAKPSSCPACHGRGWVLEVEEPSVAT